jgi:hypothetical protein
MMHSGIIIGATTRTRGGILPRAPRSIPRRLPNEFYPTPPEATRALLSVERFDGSIWEPACGEGAIANVLTSAGHKVVATDLVDYGFAISGIDFNIDAAALIRVQKRRWMRKFRVDSGAAVECCDAELTLLEAKGAAWWTFGFEAYGELAQVEDDLAVTVAVLAARNPPILPRGEASSYPRWLATLGQ